MNLQPTAECGASSTFAKGSDAINVALVVQEVSHFGEQLRLARSLMPTGRYRIHVVLGLEGPLIEGSKRTCRELGGAIFEYRDWLSWKRARSGLGTATYRAFAGVLSRFGLSRKRVREEQADGPAPPPRSRRRLCLLCVPFLAVAVVVRFALRATRKIAATCRLKARVRSMVVAPFRLCRRLAAKSGLRKTRVYSRFRSKTSQLRRSAAAKWSAAKAQVRRIAGPSAYFKRYYSFYRLLAEREIHLVVLAEDNVSHATGIFTKAARKQGVASMVLPFAISHADEFGEAFYDNPSHHLSRLVNRFVARCFPRWVRVHRGRPLLRLPGWEVLLNQLLGMSPPNPWAYNSGRTQAIVIDSEQTCDKYLAEGIERRQLQLTGSLVDDELSRHLGDRDEKRRALYAELGIQDDRPLIVCALPPNQFTSRPAPEFEDYDDLVRGWVRPLLAAKDFNVVICLHPCISRNRMLELQEELQFHISTWDTAKLVPLCDLYVASVSSTIRWAIACGKPVINYDVYDYGYADYGHAPGVIETNDYLEYRRSVARFDLDVAWRDELTRLQAETSSRWGRLDGQAARRIDDLMMTLVRRSPAARPEAVASPAREPALGS